MPHRKRAEHLGVIEAKDEADAIRKAAEMSDHRVPDQRARRRLVKPKGRSGIFQSDRSMPVPWPQDRPHVSQMLARES